jgi:hypothetical protein
MKGSASKKASRPSSASHAVLLAHNVVRSFPQKMVCVEAYAEGAVAVTERGTLVVFAPKTRDDFDADSEEERLYEARARVLRVPTPACAAAR